jgi:hypothetical protein
VNPLESEGEEAEEEEEDPSWLITSTRQHKNPILNAKPSSNIKAISERKVPGSQNIPRGVSTNKDDDLSLSEAKNLHSAVRSCVNPGTFDDLLRLASKNSATDNGSIGTRDLWRKGSLDSTNGRGGSTSEDFSHQMRKSSAPEAAAKEAVVLRFRSDALSFFKKRFLSYK